MIDLGGWTPLFTTVVRNFSWHIISARVQRTRVFKSENFN